MRHNGRDREGRDGREMAYSSVPRKIDRDDAVASPVDPIVGLGIFYVIAMLRACLLPAFSIPCTTNTTCVQTSSPGGPRRPLARRCGSVGDGLAVDDRALAIALREAAPRVADGQADRVAERDRHPQVPAMKIEKSSPPVRHEPSRHRPAVVEGPQLARWKHRARRQVQNPAGFVDVDDQRAREATNDALIRDSGELDEVNLEARQHDPTELPFSTLQFLLPSRYCEVDSELLAFAWNQFGGTAPGWPRVRAICDFVHQHLTFNYKTARPTRTALDAFREKEGVCRDFTHLAVTLCRCMNIPARYATGYLGDIGVPARRADGLQRLVRGLPRRPLVHLRRPPQRAPHRPHRDGARPRRRRRADHDVLRPEHAAPLRRRHRRGRRARGGNRRGLTAIPVQPRRRIA